MPFMGFEIGDRVIPRGNGGQGIVRAFDHRNNNIGVEMIDPNFPGHNLGGIIQSGRGWWYNPEQLRHVVPFPPPPQNPAAEIHWEPIRLWDDPQPDPDPEDFFGQEEEMVNAPGPEEPVQLIENEPDPAGLDLGAVLRRAEEQIERQAQARMEQARERAFLQEMIQRQQQAFGQQWQLVNGAGVAAGPIPAEVRMAPPVPFQPKRVKPRKEE